MTSDIRTMGELFNNLRVQNIFAFMTHTKHRSHNILQKKSKTNDKTGRKIYL